ncbi:MAG TPA: LPXTG cell wall anchor domain-containing protein, partial [Actinomycetes bacterium]|nr:LPXTG cell wall anchor domain-containing protein [Actinomycetes bacterium]
ASSSETTSGAGNSAASSTEAEAGGLPFTGTNSAVPMVIAGLLMVGLGLASLLVNRLRQRQNGA